MAGIDSYTKLMLHMNSDFSDSSDSDHTPTVNGATIDTTIKKFGAGSGKFVTASSQYVTYPDSADWDFGSGDFTKDFQARFDNSAATQGFVFQGTDADNRMGFTYIGTKFRFWVVIGGTAYLYDSSSWTATTGVWYHIALVRSGSTLYFFVEGVLK